jgi:hypothetical protein
MKILIAKKTTPIELTLIVNGCCWGIKDVTVSYSYKDFKPGMQVPRSKLKPITEKRLVVEDDLGIEYWFDSEQYVIVPFEAKVYQTIRNDPLRYILQETPEGWSLISNPDWQEPVVTIPEDHIESSEMPDMSLVSDDSKGRL